MISSFCDNPISVPLYTKHWSPLDGVDTNHPFISIYLDEQFISRFCRAPEIDTNPWVYVPAQMNVMSLRAKDLDPTYIPSTHQMDEHGSIGFMYPEDGSTQDIDRLIPQLQKETAVVNIRTYLESRAAIMARVIASGLPMDLWLNASEFERSIVSFCLNELVQHSGTRSRTNSIDAVPEWPLHSTVEQQIFREALEKRDSA